MTEFIKNFQNKLNINNFEKGFEEELYKSYSKQEKQNKHWLISKYFEYLEHDENKIYYIMHFIKFLGEKILFYDEDLIKGLKEEISNYLENENGTYDRFAISLEILFIINNDVKYFKDLFNKNKEKFSRKAIILKVFYDNFLKIEEKECFFECLVLILKSKRKIIYEFDIWQRFNSLDDSEFKKYFVKLIENFQTDEEKNTLKHYNEYAGLISKGYSKQDIKLVNTLINRISKISTNKEKTKIKRFLFGDLEYISKNYQNIEGIYFDDLLFSTLSKNNNNLLYEFLKYVDLKTISLNNAKFIGKNLNINNIQKCISLYKNHPQDFFSIYLFIKLKNKSKLLKTIRENEIFPQLKEIEKQQKKNLKIQENEEKQRILERKNGLLTLTRTDEGFYAKFLQDYCNLINDKENFKKFSESEKEKLNEAAKSQSISCLKYLSINDYSDKKIKNIVSFKKNGEGSYTTTRFVYYLTWVLQISKSLHLKISKYYKEFVALYPLVSGDDYQILFLEFLKGKIKSNDINYILTAYSEDLHENAIGLKFYNPSGLIKFYEKFGVKFSKLQIEKLKKILLDFIKSNEIKNKDNFIELYAKLVNKNDFLKIYHKPTINYFKSIISDEIPVTEEEKIEFEKQLKINELLINKFNDKNALLRRIEQIKKGIIKFNNPYSIENGEYITEVHAVSALENELEFMWDNDRSFYHIITKKRTIDIKNEMLKVFELGLKIEEKIIDYQEDHNYKAYSNYLINIFYKYVTNLTNRKKYYKSAIKTIKKYPKNGLNTSALNKYFGINPHLKSKTLNTKTRNTIEELAYKNEKINNENIKTKEYDKKLKEKYTKLQKIFGIANPKCIVFVEGATDKHILEKAYSVLYGENNDFIIRIAGGARELSELMKDNGEFEDIPIIGIFDFDHEGFCNFNNISGNYYENNLNYSGLVKKISNTVYSITLPVPSKKPDLASEILGNYSMITIESLFEENILKDFFKSKLRMKTGERKQVKFQGNSILFIPEKDEKRIFESFIKGLTNQEDFKEFKPLFKVIKKIINKILHN